MDKAKEAMACWVSEETQRATRGMAKARIWKELGIKTSSGIYKNAEFEPIMGSFLLSLEVRRALDGVE